jgi:hypothetical protein
VRANTLVVPCALFAELGHLDIDPSVLPSHPAEGLLRWRWLQNVQEGRDLVPAGRREFGREVCVRPPSPSRARVSSAGLVWRKRPQQQRGCLLLPTSLRPSFQSACSDASCLAAYPLLPPLSGPARRLASSAFPAPCRPTLRSASPPSRSSSTPRPSSTTAPSRAPPSGRRLSRARLASRRAVCPAACGMALEGKS